MTLKFRLSVFFWGALGAVVAHLLMAKGGALLPAAFAYGEQDIRARSIEMVDPQGRRRLLMATAGEGSPAIWLFDQNGKTRLNVALYADGNGAVVINDAQEQAVGIFRSVGVDAVPVFVLKEQGRDRMVLGLQTGEVSLVTWDKAGKRELVFGK